MISEADKKFPRQGILFVISAPSGAGKTTLCAALRQTPDFVYSVSCTTRPARPGEIDGEDYYFLSEQAFREHMAAGDFLECAEVHGNHYGTLRENVLVHLRVGVDVLIDIDTQGATTIRASADGLIGDALADVFIMPRVATNCAAGSSSAAPRRLSRSSGGWVTPRTRWRAGATIVTRSSADRWRKT